MASKAWSLCTHSSRHTPGANDSPGMRDRIRSRASARFLYGSLSRLLQGGLIEEGAETTDPEMGDERRRYYRITPFGTTVARAEMRRLTDLVRLAHASGLKPRTA